MNRVLVIGPTYKTEIINVRGSLETNKTFNAAIDEYLMGGSYALAYDLAVLGVDSYLLTRMGFDDSANKMIMQYDKVNGMLFSNSRKVETTPKKVMLVDKKGDLTTMDNITYDIHPNNEDGIPVAIFEKGDFGVINIINTNYLVNILKAYPNLTWISDNNVPPDEYLPAIYGLTFDSEYLKDIVEPTNYGAFARNLLDKGVGWVIVNERSSRISLYTKQGKQHYQKEEVGPYFIGCHEVFVAMLTACLANGYDLNESINHGINLANDFTYEKEMALAPALFE